MFTVALIGGDGSGKSTIANMLQKSPPLPIKYLYMGISMQSSNIALPTSRFIQFVKQYLFKRSKKHLKKSQPELMELFYQENLGPDKRGKIGATMRLLYRLSEECFRQFISWVYQLQGYVVLYDRHFIFDFAFKNRTSLEHKDRLSERLHRWFLEHLYPQPHLIIFLDAPPEVLLQRKGEYSVDYLESKRKTYIRIGEKMTNFIQIDATQPVDKVFAKVTQSIMHFHSTKSTRKIHNAEKEPENWSQSPSRAK